MTAPDQPAPATINPELIVRPAPPSQLPGSPTAGSNDLRQQLADAIRDAAHRCTDTCTDTTGHEDLPILASIGDCIHPEGEVAYVNASPDGLADVCAAVVQPVLDAKDTEIARLNTALDQAKTWITEWSKRAETAERELADLRHRYGHLAEQAQQIGG